MTPEGRMPRQPGRRPGGHKAPPPVPLAQRRAPARRRATHRWWRYSNERELDTRQLPTAFGAKRQTGEFLPTTHPEVVFPHKTSPRMFNSGPGSPRPGRHPPSRPREDHAPMHEYVDRLMEEVKAKNPAEPEFHQAVHEVAESLVLVFEKHPEYVSEQSPRAAGRGGARPDVPRSVDGRSAASVQVNRGFRVEMNSAIGPYKGRAALPPVGQPRDSQVPRVRAGLQELPHHAADGWRQRGLGFRPEGQAATARSCASVRAS